MIQNKLRAGYPGLYLVTHEEQRAEAMLAAAVAELKTAHGQEWSLFCWTYSQGLFSADGAESHPDEDALSVLDHVAKLPEKSVLILKDYHMTLAEPNPLVYRKLKDALFLAKTQSKCLVILSPILKLPPELEKLFAVVEFALPDKAQLEVVLDRICDGNGLCIARWRELLEDLRQLLRRLR